jgi:hypothetical protein
MRLSFLDWSEADQLQFDATAEIVCRIHSIGNTPWFNQFEVGADLCRLP